MDEKSGNVDIKTKSEDAAPKPDGSSLTSLRNEIDRLFDDFASGSWAQPLSGRLQGLLQMPEAWRTAPAIEVAEIDGAYRITAEMPGLAAGDIEIRLGDGAITLRGEKTEEKKEEKQNYLLSERRYGTFSRTVPLPSGIDADKASAKLDGGVLTVTLPKTAEAKQKDRKIEIETA